MDFGTPHLLDLRQGRFDPSESQLDVLRQWASEAGPRGDRARAALARRQVGTWGRCCRCGAQIPEDSLLHDPTETYCPVCWQC